VLILHPKSARKLASLQGANGGLLFPSVGTRGGTVWGTPVLVSSALEPAGSPVRALRRAARSEARDVRRRSGRRD